MTTTRSTNPEATNPEATNPEVRERREYVLGTGADELERLGLQHRLWSDAAHALWKIARVQPGMRVLDIGCGPGYASSDLAQLVQHEGSVLGVDESAGFVAHVNAQARARGLTQLSAVAGDVQRLGDALGTRPPFDFAYARWVLCFTERPEDVIAGAARALRPGGRLAIQDYFNYAAMTPAPRRDSYARAVAATVRSWRARGGDPDVVGRLPRLLRDHGFRIEHLSQHQRLARPGESMWHWTTSWWRNYIPKLVQMGELQPQEADQFFADCDAMDPETDFLVLPTVYEIVAERV
jgi:ubiquinone/menaquinone biosynthesis C-methylase UbiE